MDVVFSEKKLKNQIFNFIQKDIVPILISGCLLAWLSLISSHAQGVLGQPFVISALPLLATTLWMIGVARPGRKRFAMLTATGAIGSLTLMFGWLLVEGTEGETILLLLGVTAPPLLIRLGMLLKQATHPVASLIAGCGLGLLLNLAVTEAIPVDRNDMAHDQMLLAGGLLVLGCLLLFGTRRARLRAASFPRRLACRLCLPLSLPFMLAFQFFVGLLLAAALTLDGLSRMSGWSQACWLAGMLLAARLARRDRSVVFRAAVALSAVGLVLWQIVPTPVGLMLGLSVCLIAIGMTTTSLLTAMLEQPDPVRAFGYGLGVFLMGILAGYWFVQGVGGVSTWVMLLGLLALNLALVAQTLGARLMPVEPAPVPSSTEAVSIQCDAPDTADLDELTAPPPLPKSLAANLSRQECDVLGHIHLGLTYREIAERLAISESSVKTYVQRIFRKLGVQRRRQLVRLVERAMEESA